MIATKKDLANRLRTKIVASHKTATDIVDAVLDSIAELTHEQGKLVIRGFGRFEARRRAPRKVSTGLAAGSPPVEVPAKIALCFTAGREHVRTAD